MKKIRVIWECDLCDFKVESVAKYGEDLWAPKGLTWVRDRKEMLLCDKHFEEFSAKHPGPWIA